MQDFIRKCDPSIVSQLYFFWLVTLYSQAVPILYVPMSMSCEQLNQRVKFPSQNVGEFSESCKGKTYQDIFSHEKQKHELFDQINGISLC